MIMEMAKATEETKSPVFSNSNRVVMDPSGNTSRRGKSIVSSSLFDYRHLSMLRRTFGGGVLKGSSGLGPMGIFLFIGVMATAQGPAVIANPVKGIKECYNNEDCLGAHKECYRNTTMAVGICVCEQGYKSAKTDMIKCLSIKDNECHSQEDCPPNWFICISPTTYPSPLDGALDFSIRTGNKHCIFTQYIAGLDPHSPFEPRTGGGLRQVGGEFYNQFYQLTRKNRIHTSFNPEYIKFVEDCMLVLFLLCVLVTLMVVHRASCYRQFRRARRDGPLRYILPHSDDQPPPYSNYFGPAGPAPAVANSNVSVEPSAGDQQENVDQTDGSGQGIHRHQEAVEAMVHHSSACDRAAPAVEDCIRDRGKRSRTETPPPTYDEALAISQAICASLATAADEAEHLGREASETGDQQQQGLLYIALPSSNEDDIAGPPPPLGSGDPVGSSDDPPACPRQGVDQHRPSDDSGASRGPEDVPSSDVSAQVNQSPRPDLTSPPVLKQHSPS